MDIIKIKNFQGHEDTTIELAKTLTAITGKSHHGKSSVIRGIEWVRNNSPVGDEFVRWGTTETSVTIDNVEHRKKGTTNSYIVEGHPKPFKALRGSVPEEVTDTLNIGPDNVQDQHATPFLLKRSPGKVAQKLSNLSDLESTIAALQFISGKKRKIKSNIDTLNKSIEVTEQQLFDLRHVDSMNEELIKIERKQLQVDHLNKKHSQVYKKYQNAVSALSELNSLPNTNALQPAKNILVQYIEIQKLNTHINKLENTVQEAVSLERLLSFDPTNLLIKANRILKVYEKIARITTTSLKCSGLQGKYAGLQLKIKTLTQLKEELIGDQCPLCGAIKNEKRTS